MAIRQGTYDRVLIYKELVRGAQPTTLTGHVMPLMSRTFDLHEQAIKPRYEINGMPNPAQPGRDVLAADGNIVVPVDEVGVGLWLMLLLAAYTKSGSADPYSHVFQVLGADPLSFGMELGNTGVSKFDVIPGCAVKSIAIDVQKNPDKATLTVEVVGLVGAGPTLNAATSVSAAPNTYLTSRYNLFGSGVKVGGSVTGMIQQMKLTIARNVTAEQVLDGNRYPAFVSFGNFTISGTIQGLWDDVDTLRLKAMSAAGAAGSPTSLELDLVAMTAGHSLTFLMPETLIALSAAPGVPATPGAKKLTLDFQSYYQSNASSPITATLLNATADYGAVFVAA
ncbi:MAG: phage tail tube protein [Thermoanaerobaculaceae bacterium]|jgi:hypothetical protein